MFAVNSAVGKTREYIYIYSSVSMQGPSFKIKLNRGKATIKERVARLNLSLEVVEQKTAAQIE